jgi:hypothetical protein
VAAARWLRQWLQQQAVTCSQIRPCRVICTDGMHGHSLCLG